ncbi:hypothetical protein BOX15_Mlig028165g2 [Macrostomum lignano]|uniref:Moesin/ezrin/radixin homolog 1 n=2 Tax=Macrostomum lignano TaxID=282301 RepID=A0A267DUW6_9PLAT|nr:hypothetical protein BOX15_Mlig028165g2 [Macrostomum lignano]
MSESRKTPPTSPRRGGGGSGGGKTLTVKVVMLDDTVNSFQVPSRVAGQELFNAVVKKLKLLEIDYFDLEFLSKEGRQCWLDHEKTLPKQCPATIELIFYFSVKFYPPDPHLLEDEYTRFLFALQIKRDLVNGLLPCAENTMALLASYLVQAEIGDFLEEEYLDTLYLTQLKVLPQPYTEDLLKKVMEYHKAHIGLTPEDSEYSLLDTARKVELYGIRLHPAKDHEGLPLNLAVAHAGVLVFQNTSRINTFSWAKVRKLSFKRKKFLVKLHPEGYGYYKDTVEFYFDSRDECKHFWKKCIEHHTFFRCQAVKLTNRPKPKVVSKGSTFRYCGRTQKQLVEFVRENYVKRPHFDRGSGARSLPSRSPGARRAPHLQQSSQFNTQQREHRPHLLNSSSARSATSTSSGSHTLLLLGELASSRELGLQQQHFRLHHHGRHANSNSSSAAAAGAGANSEATPGNHRSVTASPTSSTPSRQPYGRARSLPDGGEGVEEERRRTSPKRETPADGRLDVSEEAPLPPDGVDLPPPPLSEQDDSTELAQQQQQKQKGPPYIAGGTYETRMRAAGSGDRASTILGDREELAIIQDCADEGLQPRPAPGRGGGLNGADQQQLAASSPPPMPPPSPPPPPPPLSQGGEAIDAGDLGEDDDAGDADRRGRCYGGGGAHSVASHTLALSGAGSGSARGGGGGCGLSTDADSDADARSTASSAFSSAGGYRGRRSKQHFPTERPYYLCKELLMTERAYRRDLEILCDHLRKAVGHLPDAETVLGPAWSVLDQLREEHAHLLRDLEQRLHAWERSAVVIATALANGQAPPPMEQHRVAEVLLRHLRLLPWYRKYMEGAPEMLLSLFRALRDNRQLEDAVRAFESQKLCYLPLACLLLAPAHRLLHYRRICNLLLCHYGNGDEAESPDAQDSRLLQAQLLDALTQHRDSCIRAEQLNQLAELQRDVLGADSLLNPLADRPAAFVRLGWLKKLSRRGFAARLFFLTGDTLLYASRGSLQLLKLHGHLPMSPPDAVAAVPIDSASGPDGEQHRAMLDAASLAACDAEPHSFAVFGGRPRRAFVLAARSEADRQLWLRDIAWVASSSASLADPPSPTAQQAAAVSSANPSSSTERHHIQQRSFFTAHVCWHRCATVGFQDIVRCHDCRISGHLLRKFKNSGGWQRLWVVFSHFSLFFYKSYHDEAPMATLPLIGYRISQPDESDAHLTQGKSNVFKLQWKHHEYFFRTDCQYTFERWFDSINSAISPAKSREPRHQQQQQQQTSTKQH